MAESSTPALATIIKVQANLNYSLRLCLRKEKESMGVIIVAKWREHYKET